MADDDLKNAFDNIVEDIELYLNNFEQLKKVLLDSMGLKRQLCRNWNKKGFIKESLLAKRERFNKMDHGDESKFFTLGISSL